LYDVLALGNTMYYFRIHQNTQYEQSTSI